MQEEEKMKRIYDRQRQMAENFRNVPKNGQEIEYLGKKFIVLPTVFWPSWDSQALVKNYHINFGESVLDLCTGSGVIAIFSAINGASKVIALDINPEAIRCTKKNAVKHNVEKVIEAKVSDMFEALDNEKFDVITMNPPFTLHDSKDHSERTIWDKDLMVHKKFFNNVKKYLKENGRIYLAHANFGAIKEMKSMALEQGFSIKQIGETKVDEDRTFYAFELKLKNN